jgi:AcrR family transcriptional regulator
LTFVSARGIRFLVPRALATVSTVPAPAPTARGRQRDQTRLRVFEAALRLFREKGVAACSVDDIARRAGVSHGTFYFHFPGKDDVLAELLARSEERAVRAIGRVPAEAAIGELLARVGAAIADNWENDAALFADVAAVALRLTSRAPAEQSNDPVRRALAARFTTAAARGELIPAVPPAVLSDLFLLNQFAVALAWCTRPQGRMAVALQGAAMLFLRGAAAGPAPRRKTPRRARGRR